MQEAESLALPGPGTTITAVLGKDFHQWPQLKPAKLRQLTAPELHASYLHVLFPSTHPDTDVPVSMLECIEDMIVAHSPSQQQDQSNAKFGADK